MLDGLSIYALSLQCALSAPADVAASVALYESHGNPFAVKINNLPIDTNSEASAIATVSEAIVNL